MDGLLPTQRSWPQWNWMFLQKWVGKITKIVVNWTEDKVLLNGPLKHAFWSNQQVIFFLKAIMGVNSITAAPWLKMNGLSCFGHYRVLRIDMQLKLWCGHQYWIFWCFKCKDNYAGKLRRRVGKKKNHRSRNPSSFCCPRLENVVVPLVIFLNLGDFWVVLPTLDLLCKLCKPSCTPCSLCMLPQKFTSLVINLCFLSKTQPKPDILASCPLNINR